VVGENATVVTFDDKMQMVVLKKGTNGFTCIPERPDDAFKRPGVPRRERPGVVDRAYQEGSGTAFGQDRLRLHAPGRDGQSNVDPFAPPPADGKWSEAGPHIMILGAKEAMAGYPRPGRSRM